MLTRSRRALALPELSTLAAGGVVLLVAAALIVLPPLLGALLLVGAVVGTLVLVRPLWGFYLLLLSIPLQDLGAVGELTATNVVLALTIVAWLARRLAFGGRPLPPTLVGPVFALFVGGLALSLIAAREIAPGIAALFQWAKALAVYFLALDFLRTRRQALGALAALLIAGAGEGAIGLVQYVTGVGPASFAVGGQFSRAFGTFGRPNSYAGYLEMIFPLGLALCVVAFARWRAREGVTVAPNKLSPGRPFSRSPLHFLIALGATGVIGAAILASFSRGAWLGTTGAVALMILLAGVRARVAAIAAAVVLTLVLLAGGANYLPPGFADRLTNALMSAETPDVRTAYITAENFATVERRSHWEAGLQMFYANRALGVGLGNFNVRFSDFTVSPTFLISQGHAHNFYIHVAAEAGLVGLTGYLLLLAAIVATGLRSYWLAGRPGADPAARPIAIACLGVVAAVAIHNLFENLHVLSMGVQLSTVWALLTIVAQPAWRQATAPDREA
jgi:O-antigen ligase